MDTLRRNPRGGSRDDGFDTGRVGKTRELCVRVCRDWCDEVLRCQCESSDGRDDL